MTKNTRRAQRGEAALTRETIIDAAIALLDSAGESGLTFRALAMALTTGAGAIYFHVANKDDLVNAACDAVVARAMEATVTAATPQGRLRAIGLELFDAIDAHPWVGAELARAPGSMPTVRILEGIGQQVQAMDVVERALWSATSTLFSYIVGVAGQNAANARIGQRRGLDRSTFLDAMGLRWSQLDADAYPFTRSMATQLREHDDRADFVAGLDLILDGIAAQRLLGAGAGGQV
ncbi:MAG TPA: TetR family transcriptional regulator [Duganella sp.]|nr:TetR family transcriptional regulator [Duganella sp.]